MQTQEGGGGEIVVVHLVLFMLQNILKVNGISRNGTLQDLSRPRFWAV